MLTSLELEDILASDEDSRNWYFDRLQPVFNRMRDYMERLSDVLYDQLQQNSEEFDRGFYRSIIPSSAAVVVGILLIFLLMFFILTYYIRPLYRMLSALENYRSIGKKYNLEFEGDDQLGQLNDGIRELSEENRQLRRRLKDLKERLSGE
jgi:methyl-accepting chemotaxis protein